MSWKKRKEKQVSEREWDLILRFPPNFFFQLSLCSSPESSRHHPKHHVVQGWLEGSSLLKMIRTLNMDFWGNFGIIICWKKWLLYSIRYVTTAEGRLGSLSPAWSVLCFCSQFHTDIRDVRHSCLPDVFTDSFFLPLSARHVRSTEVIGVSTVSLFHGI